MYRYLTIEGLIDSVFKTRDSLYHMGYDLLASYPIGRYGQSRELGWAYGVDGVDGVDGV